MGGKCPTEWDLFVCMDILEGKGEIVSLSLGWSYETKGINRPANQTIEIDKVALSLVYSPSNI